MTTSLQQWVANNLHPQLHHHDNPLPIRPTPKMAAVVAPGHVPPAPIKEQVVDHLPKRFKEMKFGIQ